MFERIRGFLGGSAAKKVLSSNASSHQSAKRNSDSITIMLSEMQRLFDAAQKVLQRWAERSMAFLSVEVSLATFCITRENGIIDLARSGAFNRGEYWLLLLMLVLWAAAAVLFLVAMVYSRKSLRPPDVEKLVEENLRMTNRYSTMNEDDLRMELIIEYHNTTKASVKKITATRTLVHVGLFLLTAGVVFLLILKIFVI